MDVADDRAGRQARPCRGARTGDYRVEVERVGGHGDFARAPRPGLGRAIHIHFHLQAIGIGEVERLAHEVVGRAHRHANVRGVDNEPAEIGARRQQHGKVVEADEAAPRHRAHAPLLVQLEQPCVAALDRTEAHHPVAILQPLCYRTHSKDILVEPPRPLEVGHLARDAADVPFRGQHGRGQRPVYPSAASRADGFSRSVYSIVHVDGKSRTGRSRRSTVISTLDGTSRSVSLDDSIHRAATYESGSIRLSTLYSDRSRATMTSNCSVPATPTMGSRAPVGVKNTCIRPSSSSWLTPSSNCLWRWLSRRSRPKCSAGNRSIGGNRTARPVYSESPMARRPGLTSPTMSPA